MIISMGNQTDSAASPGISSRVTGYLFLFGGVFALTWLATFGWQNRVLIIDLFYQSSLERYQVATGDAGPVTFHVYHSDFKALEQVTRSNDEILGIEMTKNSGVAAMAFSSHEVAAIATIRENPVVSRMLRRNIPMLCH